MSQIYKDIKNLESIYNMIKKLEADEFIIEKLIKHLETMKPPNYMRVLKYFSNMLNMIDKLKMPIMI